MPRKVERTIEHIQKSAGVPKGNAIAIAKSRGLVKQKGKHLGPGPKLQKGRRDDYSRKR